MAPRSSQATGDPDGHQGAFTATISETALGVGGGHKKHIFVFLHATLSVFNVYYL